MRDYAELVKALRNNAEHFMTTDFEWSNALVHLLLDSADAIEEKKERAEMIGLDGDICYLPNTLRQIVISNPNMGEFKKETLCNAADAIEELLAAVPKWHPVSNPPKENGRYYVAYEDSVSFLDYFNGKWFFPPRNGIVTEETKESILYWKPLPEPPKEVE